MKEKSEVAEVAEVESIVDTQFQHEERKLVRKFDLVLMPLFCSAYFFAALDRSNIGNANVAGMSDDIGLSATQYSNAVSMVYATYLPMMLPGVWLLRKFKKPRYYMGGMILCWSLVSIFTVFVNSYGSLLAVRLLLGLCEGSFFSCMTLIATDYYLPTEIGRRTSYYFVASALSSSFGGLIATGITKVHSGALESWRYLYLIEGLLSFLCGLCVFFLLPDGPDDLVKTPIEKEIHANRTLRRKLYQGSVDFDKNEFFSAFDLKIAFSVVIQFCQDVCLYGFSTFLPSILKSGLNFDSLEAQYMTVPVYIFSAVVYLVFAEISDRKKLRGPIIVLSNVFGITGYIILLSVDKASVKYFACYLICFSLYIGTGVNESWIASNTAPAFKRGCAIAINQTLGNVAGAISPQVYIHPPAYRLGHFFTLGCLCLSSVTAIVCSLYLHRKNQINKRILAEGVDSRNEKRKHGDDSPEFEFLI